VIKPHPFSEQKVRVEDALHATRAAVEEGVAPGGDGMGDMRESGDIHNSFMSFSSSGKNVGVPCLLIS
jgi:chaperonin GroEL (HSP60 family)